jgi:ATP-dependent helicase/nuclease subunit A
MNDVERAAFVLLSDPVLSGWVQERLDARVSQLLIDEFQDTNPLQWQALSAWLSAYAGSGGRAPCVFLVGDPKQSIYRFRRAEPQVFVAAKKFMVDALGGAVLSCDHTRRNSRQVIGAVNTVMTQAAVQDGYNGFRLHTSSSDEEGQVWRLPQIPRPPQKSNTPDLLHNELPAELPWRDSLVTPRELPEETLRTLEARQAAQWLAQHLASGQRSEARQLEPKDLMVLSRQRVGLLPLQIELRKLGIAAQIGEKTELMDCCEVQDLTALLDVLVSPQHDLSLARVLKSPLFGLGDAELVHLALQLRQAQVEQAAATQMPSWFDLLQTQELLTHDGRGVGATLSRWKGWLDQLPPFDALQAIYTDGDVLARFAMAAPTHNRDTVVRNLTALLEVSLQNGGGRYATPYAFVRALNAGGVQAPAAMDPHALRLLTVHGAKGLEAQTVLLLDSDSPERNTPTMTVLVDWPAHSAWPQKFVFLTSESQPPFCVQAELQAEHQERGREELNSLYVALTRARTTLVISSIAPHRKSDGSWWQRLFDLAQAHQAILPDVDNKRLTDAVDPPAPELIDLKELPMIPEKLKFPATNNEAPEMLQEVPEGDDTLARIGLAMHRLLEWGGVSPNNTAAVMQEFLLSAEQGGLASDMARRILDGQGAWAWDSRVVGWQGVEVELMYQGEPLRLDRLVQRQDAGHEGEWWVLDYKMSAAPQDQPELMAQLTHYRDAVQQIYPDAMVRAAFLTPQGLMIELEPEQ